jgi:hypothetical protein
VCYDNDDSTGDVKEESQYDDVDDGNDSDRKSKQWNGNVITRLVNGNGTTLYACDQCDKSFGKQSSLARHRYEHSGN